MLIYPIRKTQSSATFVVAASDSTSDGKLRADYVCDGTDDDVQIQAALDALPSGGGKVLLLEGTFTIGTTIAPIKDNWDLSGMGKGTIVKLKNSGNTNIFKTNDGITDWTIRDIYFDGNKANQASAAAAIYIDNTSMAGMHSFLHNIRVENSKGVGIYAIKPRRCHLVQSIIQNNDSHGIHITDEHLEMYGCRIQYNGGDGLHAEDMADNILTDCQFQHNTGHGINFVSTSIVSNCNIMTNSGYGIASASSSRINGCGIRWNAQTGIKLASHCVFTGCRVGNNSYGDSGSYDNVEINNGWCTLVMGNQIGSYTGDARYCINISNDPDAPTIAIIGNTFRKETSSILNTSTENYIWLGNSVDGPVPEQKIMKYKNTSGGQLVEGDVVVLKSVAAGNEITTTNTQGDDKVLGMVAETIENNAEGRILVLGKTAHLKVNGTTDIAIGDYLCTFTTAKIACKAETGDMAFAIALEAYSTDDSNGVIDAILIEPRKIVGKSPTFASVTADIITTDINENIAQDVKYFEDLSVDNADQGQSVYVYRNAAEGKDYLRFYVRNSRYSQIDASYRFALAIAGSAKFIIDGSFNTNYLPVKLNSIKSGATQAAAGAAATELWKTNGHATLPDNVVMIGV